MWAMIVVVADVLVKHQVPAPPRGLRVAAAFTEVGYAI
jgi:hypothetical protein